VEQCVVTVVVGNLRNWYYGEFSRLGSQAITEILFWGRGEKMREPRDLQCTSLNTDVIIARCYASAVLAMALCLSVLPSVRHKSVFYYNAAKRRIT